MGITLNLSVRGKPSCEELDQKFRKSSQLGLVTDTEEAAREIHKNECEIDPNREVYLKTQVYFERLNALESAVENSLSALNAEQLVELQKDLENTSSIFQSLSRGAVNDIKTTIDQIPEKNRPSDLEYKVLASYYNNINKWRAQFNVARINELDKMINAVMPKVTPPSGENSPSEAEKNEATAKPSPEVNPTETETNNPSPTTQAEKSSYAPTFNKSDDYFLNLGVNYGKLNVQNAAGLDHHILEAQVTAGIRIHPMADPDHLVLVGGKITGGQVNDALSQKGFGGAFNSKTNVFSLGPVFKYHYIFNGILEAGPALGFGLGLIRTPKASGLRFNENPARRELTETSAYVSAGVEACLLGGTICAEGGYLGFLAINPNIPGTTRTEAFSMGGFFAGLGLDIARLFPQENQRFKGNLSQRIRDYRKRRGAVKAHKDSKENTSEAVSPPAPFPKDLPKGRIVGQVVDPEGNPIPNTIVYFPGISTTSVVTDVNGRFISFKFPEWEEIPIRLQIDGESVAVEEDIKIKGNADSLITITSEGKIVESSTEVHDSSQLSSLKGRIAGRVLGPDGVPIPNALILFPGLTTTAVLTDEEGTFMSFRFPEGQVAIQVIINEQIVAETTVEIKNNENTLVTIPLEATPTPPTSVVQGAVTNQKGEPVQFSMRVIGQGVDQSFDSTPGGLIALELYEGDYKATITANGYKSKTIKFSVPKDGEIQISETLELGKPSDTPNVTGSSRGIKLLRPIRYDGNDVAQKSHAILDELALFLNSHPEFKLIQINVHTDDHGNPQARTEARAEAVKFYLVSKGVSPARIKPKGWGDKKPIAANLTAAGRAKNNRTSISVSDYLE